MTSLTKYLFIIVLLFCNSWGNENQYNLGIINGLNDSYMSIDNKSPFKFEDSPQFKYNIYLYIDYNICPSISINSGIKFSFMKIRVNDNTTYNVGTELPDYYTYDFNYFVLPLRFKYKLNNIYFVSGAEIGYLLSKDKLIKSSFPGNNETYKKYNLSGNIGFGYKINYNSSDIIFEIGYSKGFVNIIKESRRFRDLKTNELYINFGLEFNL